MARYPDIVPGPGLPSIESLNLTSTMLYEMDILDSVIATRGVLSKRSQHYLSMRLLINDAAACYNYLNNIGSVDCGLYGQGNYINFVYAGTASVYGYNQGPNFYVASHCSDVAIAVLQSMQACSDNTSVGISDGGRNVATGNGFLGVGLLQTGAGH